MRAAPAYRERLSDFQPDSPHFTISKKHHSQLPVSSDKTNATQSLYKK
jgi:hypothetical protein